jgi:hypothetical protein
MRKLITLALLLTSLISIAGCGQSGLDASSEEAFKKSCEEARKGMDDARKDKFDSAVATLMMSNVMDNFGDEAAAKAKMKETFDGKTPDQIIEAGEKAQAATKAEIDKMMKQ